MHLEFYSFAELISIIKRGASLLSTNIGDEGAQEIANRARGTPRIALRLLRRIRDFLQNSSNIITHSVADYALQKLKIDKMGLDKLDINYLKFIANSSDPVGIDTISVALSEDRGNIEEAVEPYLIRINFLQRTPRGRILTSEAREYLSSKDN